MSFYDQGASPTSWAAAPTLEQDAQASAQAGLQQGRLTRNFSQYDLPSILSQHAARGSFYSGGNLQAANRAQEQTNENVGDIGTSLQALLAGNAQRRTAAVTGGGF